MKGRLASRAHSFKENFLGAFGHASPPSPIPSDPGPHRAAAKFKCKSTSSASSEDDSASAFRSLVKKTNSSDNLIEFQPKSSDALVKEVQFALRYFEDAVSKGTYDLLPGCATVVLETVLSIQSFAMAKMSQMEEGVPSAASSRPTGRRGKHRHHCGSVARDGQRRVGLSAAKVLDAMDNVCGSVARLIQWADRVIVDGCVDPSEDYLNKVIDPVRKAVIILANLIGQHQVSKSTSLHNSLPDIAVSTTPPQLPARQLRLADDRSLALDTTAPPLPPKQVRPAAATGLAPLAQLDEDDVAFTEQHNLDWFSNPLFDSTRSTMRTTARMANSKCANHKNDLLQTTVPDFCRLPDQSSRSSVGSFTYIDVSPNMSRDSLFFDQASSDAMAGHTLDDTSSTTSSEVPPALPRKAIHRPSDRSAPSPRPSDASASSERKKSQYDNLFQPPLMFASSPMPSAANCQQPHIQMLPSLRSASTMSTFQTTSPPAFMLEKRPMSCIDGSQNPPPLPPKKRNIKSYMEMFGRSILPNSDDLMRSIAHTQDLLQAVWQQNYHEFTDYGEVANLGQSSSNFLLGSSRFEPLPRFIPKAAFSHSTPQQIPLPFPNLAEDYHVEDGDDDEDDDDAITTEDTGRSSPPALPPKKNVSSSCSSKSYKQPGTSDGVAARSSAEERIIPIIRESDGSIIQCNRKNTASTTIPFLASATSSQPGDRLSCVSDSAASSSSSSGLGTETHSHRQSYTSYEDPASQSGKFRPAKMETSPIKACATVTEIKSPAKSCSSSSSAKNKRSSYKRKKQPQLQPLPISSTHKSSSSSSFVSPIALVSSGNVMDMPDVFELSSELLLYNEDEGKDLLRAGSVDALIVLATQSYKNDFLYQEAFLATYRTFVSTHHLLEKLVYRFRRFNRRAELDNGGAHEISLQQRRQQEQLNKRVAHCAFSLLVRVVDGLADCDFIDTSIMELLTDFMAELVCDSELMLARALRSKFIQKYEERRSRLLPDLDTSGLSLSSKPPSLLHFKSIDLAEQMTMLDAQLFMNLDSAELILWVQEQNEDKSPNLTKFTEHFNNMSYWCRTKILQQEDARERERLVMKFIKIMKWLRKYNNFNSYLALLSALDSAPIRRLEWQKSITDGLKEYCALIDSSSSFRAYRLALAESKPPCIPYVGLVLQDLTFVHIGNPDKFESKVNFAKRWQQFNILDNLRRFKKETYRFHRRDDIIHFFANFEQFWSEDQMWEVSEKIKPRGHKVIK